MHQQEKVLEIKASPAKCFETICDFESYPEWQKSIQQAVVLEREDGRPVIVEYTLDAMLKSINYTLRYEYEDKDPKRMVLRWFYVGGDLKKIEGRYIFEEIGPEKTRAKFYLEVDIGIWAPKFVLEKFKELTMKESIQSLKERVESAASGE